MRIVSFDIGVVNLVCVVMERAVPELSEFSILSWDKWNIGSSYSVTEDLVCRLLGQLDDSFDAGLFTDIGAIVIERQMVVKMTVLVHTIQAFFILRKLCPAERIHIQHGTRKNECGQFFLKVGLFPADSGRARYTEYKKRAVHDAAQALTLQSNPEWVLFFEREPKQDDLADALLHGVWFLFVKKR
jgi:hypothetical protein